MSKGLKILIWIIGAILILVLVIPLLIPIPPLRGTFPYSELADLDSQFVEINGINVHYKTYGKEVPTIILLHGFGASQFSWSKIADSLSRYGGVIAYDRPGFGLTSRPKSGSWKGVNPYGIEGQVEMLIDLMDHFEVQKAILMGNSAGGAVALAAAYKYPGRVQALILVDAAVYSSSPFPDWIRRLMNTPQANRLGPLFLRSFGKRGEQLIYTAWHDPSRVTQEILDEYKKPLLTENWDQGLWNFSAAPQADDLAGRLHELNMPVLVLTGDDDRIVPTENSLRLASEIPGSMLFVFQACGHVPQEECPEQFIGAFDQFMVNEIKGGGK